MLRNSAILSYIYPRLDRYRSRPLSKPPSPDVKARAPPDARQPTEVMEPRRSPRRMKPMPPSLAALDEDVILHMCELVCNPLGGSFTVLTKMSEACKRWHALLRPSLHELRLAVRAIRALEALGCPLWALRQRCLHISTFWQLGFCRVDMCDPWLRSRTQAMYSPQLSAIPQDKTERLLATLLPHRAFSDLTALRIVRSDSLTEHRCISVSRIMGQLRQSSLPNLKLLDLSGSLLSISSRGLRSGLSALVSALACGAMRRLEKLHLSKVGIDDAGLHALGAALMCSFCSFGQTLLVLNVDGNTITELEPLAGLHIRHLSAMRNPLFTATLASLLDGHAFPALRSLQFTSHQGEEANDGHFALKAACEVRGVTCHCALLTQPLSESFIWVLVMFYMLVQCSICINAPEGLPTRHTHK